MLGLQTIIKIYYSSDYANLIKIKKLFDEYGRQGKYDLIRYEGGQYSIVVKNKQGTK